MRRLKTLVGAGSFAYASTDTDPRTGPQRAAGLAKKAEAARITGLFTADLLQTDPEGIGGVTGSQEPIVTLAALSQITSQIGLGHHADRIHVAIVSPPDIYGKGKGLVKTHSAMIPMFVSEARKLGRTFYYRDGTNTRSWVHIDDLMRVYLHVINAAANNSSEATKAYFGENGYHFAGTQECSQIELATAVGKLLASHDVINDAKPVQVGLEELDAMSNIPNFPKLARYLYASNSRTGAERAGRLWGYKAEAPGLMEVLESDVLDALKRV